MRKLLFLFALLPTIAFGQGTVIQQNPVAPSGGNFNKQVFQWSNGSFINNLSAPIGTNATLNNATPREGLFFFATQDTTIQVFHNGHFIPFGGGGSSSSIYFDRRVTGGLGTFASPITWPATFQMFQNEYWQNNGNIAKYDSLQVLNAPVNANGVLRKADINTLIYPSQTGQSGKVLGTNGSTVSWVTGGGGGSTRTTIYTGDSTLSSNRYVHSGGHYIQFDSLNVLNAPLYSTQVARLADLDFPPTILTGMATTAVTTTATTALGTYRLNNITYSIGSTNTTIPAQDATQSRISILWITTPGTIGITNGALSLSDPVEPSYPANSVQVASILITPSTITVGGGGKKGTGTVTQVSVVNANGISGSVANSTTTPALTLTLNTIKPNVKAQTPAGTAGTDSVMVKHSDGTIKAISPTYYGTGGGGGVTTVGTFSGSSQTNGASISGTTITFGPADATNPGMVSTSAQNFLGQKTFHGGWTTADNFTQAAWGLTGINTNIAAATYTDNSTAAGATVATIAANTVNAPTFVASNATSGSKVTYTNAYDYYFSDPIVGTNTLFTNKWTAGFQGNINVGGLANIAGNANVGGNTVMTGTLSVGGVDFQTALNAKVDQYGAQIYAVASGTNTYTATISPAITSYVTGATYAIKFTNSNTSGTCTLNLNGLGAISLLAFSSRDIMSGYIGAGQIINCTYDGANFVMFDMPINGIILADDGVNTQAAGFRLSGNSSISGILTCLNTLNITGAGYIQLSGTKTWFLDVETENGFNGATFSRTANPAFKFYDGGVFQMHNGSTVYTGSWNINGSKTAQTSTQIFNTITSVMFTGIYEFGIAADITSGTGTVAFTVTYTDVNGNSQTATFGTLTPVAGLAVSAYAPQRVWVKTGTTINMIATVSGTVTYDAIGTITMFNN